jgi:hypothetical protein
MVYVQHAYRVTYLFISDTVIDEYLRCSMLFDKSLNLLRSTYRNFKALTNVVQLAPVDAHANNTSTLTPKAVQLLPADTRLSNLRSRLGLRAPSGRGSAAA